MTGVWNIRRGEGYANGDTAWKAVLIAKIAVVALAGLGVLLHQRAPPPADWPCGARSEGWPAWLHW